MVDLPSCEPNALFCSAQGYQKGNFETDYFTVRNWAHNLQT